VRLRGDIAVWLAGRTPRERVLLGLAAVTALGLALAAAALEVREDLRALSARVAGHERELAAVRRLAGALRRGAGAAPREEPEAPSLLSRLEAAAAETVGRERVTGMTPTLSALDDGTQEERIELRLSGATLAEVVRLLHALEAGNTPVPVVRLELRKLPDDATRFAATVEVLRFGSGS
jgi:hypothetical protein